MEMENEKVAKDKSAQEMTIGMDMLTYNWVIAMEESFDSIQFYSILFNSIQLYLIQFDSIRFNSIRFDLIQIHSIRFD